MGELEPYLASICFDKGYELKDSEDGKALMELYGNKSYIPICKFNAQDESTIDSVTSSLQRIIQKQSALPPAYRSALSYLFAELTGNIHDHSGSQYGFMFSQYLQREGCINLCIADNGISVYGSFVKSRKFSPDVLREEGQVLEMALSHYSTKNLPNQENRGFGLPTTKRMLAEGMKGSFFMMSGGAFHRHDGNGPITVGLPKGIEWEGTIILLKIPVRIPESFNYLHYTERI